jgi:hypothetical protein
MNKTITLPFTLAALVSVFSLACSSEDGRSGGADNDTGGQTSGGASGTGATASTGGSTQGTGAAAGVGGTGTGGDAAGTGGAVGTGGAGTGGGGSQLDCSGSGSAEYGTASLLDSDTCLLWMRSYATDGANPKLMNNKQAPNYCGDLVQDGFDDWRAPKPEELESWPNLAVNSSYQYITHPEYIETQYSANTEGGCAANSKSCNITVWSEGSVTHSFANVQGVVVCVRGEAKAGSLDMNYAASTLCASDVATHIETDCSPYAAPY